VRVITRISGGDLHTERVRVNPPFWKGLNVRDMGKNIFTVWANRLIYKRKG